MSVKVNFSATDASFTSAVKKVDASMKGMDDGVKKASSSVRMSFASMVKAGAALAIGFGAIKMAASAIAGTMGEFKAALDLGGELNDLSSRTGETAGNLMILNRAFQNAGAGADKVGPTINKLQKFMEESAQGVTANVETLERLGLSYDSIKGKAPLDQMKILADRISSIKDPAERATAAMQIFGRSGGELLPLLNSFSSEVDKANAQLGSMPGILDKNNQVFDSISDNLKVINGKFMEFATGLLSTVAPALDLITTLITRIDTAAMGLRLGEVITGASNAMNGFSDALAAVKLGEFGTAWKITWASIKLQAADSINSIWVNVQAMGGSIMAFFGEMFRPDGDLGFAIKDLFEYLGNTFAISISKALMPVIASIPGLGKGAADALQQAVYRAEVDAGFAADRMKGHFSHVPEQMIAGFEIAKARHAELLGGANKLVDTTKMEVDLQKSKSALMDAQVKDLFDQAEAMQRMRGEFDMMSDVRGKSADSFNMMDHLRVQEKITKELKEQLTISQEMAKTITESGQSGNSAKGKRIQDDFKTAMSEGNNPAARRAQRAMERSEQDEQINNAFGGGKFGKSVQDMAKEQGISTFGKTSKDLRKELADRAKERQGDMIPGKGGKKGEVPGAPKAGVNPLDEIKKAVNAIQKLVEKIEPKLPTAALGV